VRRACVVIGVLLTSGPWAGHAPAQDAPARSLDPKEVAAVDEAVRAVMDEQGLVGLALGVIREGKVVYLRGYGLADREAGTPVTTETVFNWASNAKPMAAVLAMQLVEQGKLELDADVRQYVPELPAKDSAITCRQILCHQSGMPHYKNGRVVPIGRDSPRAEGLDPLFSLDRFGGSPLIFEPGAKAAYSSHAYILLSCAIQKAAGRPYDELVRERIAGPLGMASLQLDGGTPGPKWAVGYRKDDAGEVVRADEEANDWKFGAGGYKSDVRDFARWAEALVEHRLVRAETERVMWSPQPTKDGEATGYGLGFGVRRGKGGLRVSHNGGQPEVATRMVLYPEARHGVVAMSNCSFAKIGEVTKAVDSAIGREP
jgi:serine beta-lactamase-like protein LACTB, mitochondrial